MTRSFRVLCATALAAASLAVAAPPANAMMCPTLEVLPDLQTSPPTPTVDEAVCLVMKTVLGPVCAEFNCE